MKKRDFFRAFLVKDRNEQGRSNPLFPVAKKSFYKKILKPGLITLVIGLTFYVTYAFLHQDRFYTRSIIINGIYSLSENEVKEKIDSSLNTRSFLIFPARHHWFFHKDRLQEELESAFPLLVKDITVENQTMTISVEEDIVMVAVHTGESWYLVNLEGKIIRPLSSSEITLLFSADDQNSPPQIPFNRLPKIELGITPSSLENGASVIDEELLNALLITNAKFHSLGLTPKNFTLRNTEDSWISIALIEKKYLVYLDLKKSITDELSAFKTVMDKYSGKDEDISYIDVRFGNHVYLK